MRLSKYSSLAHRVLATQEEQLLGVRRWSLDYDDACRLCNRDELLWEAWFGQENFDGVRLGAVNE